MIHIKRIEVLIHGFLNHKIDIVELMNSLSTLYFENDRNLESEIRSLEENLERIYFCCSNTVQYDEAKKILDTFLLANCKGIKENEAIGKKC